MSNMSKDKRIAIRMSEIDLEMVKRLATIEKRTISGYIRWLINLEVDKRLALKDASYDN